MIELPSIDPKRLRDRVGFLRSRAEANLESSSNQKKFYAAILLRDSASVNFLSDKPEDACKDLLESGKLFLELGLAEGAALVALSDTQNAYSILEKYSDVTGTSFNQINWDGKNPELEGQNTQMNNLGYGSLYQIFSLFQAQLLLRKVSKFQPFSESNQLLNALNNYRWHPVGKTGLSFYEYIQIAEWVSENPPIPPYPIRQFLDYFHITRAEYIQTAMEDTYHWRMLLNPTELLDLDMVILLYLSLSNVDFEHRTSYWRVLGFSEKETSIHMAPLHVAQALDQKNRKYSV